MKVVVIGGKLQGVEASYLAHKEGWEVILIDKDRSAPAIGLCDKYHHLDLTVESDKLTDIFQKADLIIPAVEDLAVLECLVKIADSGNFPLAFDRSAYAVSSSKRESDILFSKNGISAPSYWPQCNLPVIIKHSNLSGSRDVLKINDPDQLADFIKKHKTDLTDWVIQDYLEGPSYSLEVIGFKGTPLTFQVTDLEIDSGFDCKRVTAPTALQQVQEKRFREIAAKLAGIMNLHGIMDVEVIDHNGTLKVLEIDARLPSQTPTVVYKSTGINLLKALMDIYASDCMPNLQSCPKKKNRAVIYEHIHVTEELAETVGEHIMTGGGHLSYIEGFFGADEALTNYKSSADSWVATLIITGNSRKEAWQKRREVIKVIMKHSWLSLYVDRTPATNNGCHHYSSSE